MKAIIEVAKRGSAVLAARTQARTLFSELTPARVGLLETLRRVGPCSVNSLAKAAARNDSNVHTDVGRLERLGRVERTDEGTVPVPFQAVEILVPLTFSA